MLGTVPVPQPGLICVPPGGWGLPARVPAPLSSGFLADGLHNSPDLWSSPGAMSQSSYGAMLGSSSSPLPQSSGFNSLHQHERMVMCPHGCHLPVTSSPGTWVLPRLPKPHSFPRAPLTALPLPARTTSCIQER